VYINNVSQSTAAYSFSGATKFDMNGVSIPRIGIGCLVGRTSIYTGDIGHLYLNFSETLDLSVAANREKFALAGVPVNLGDNGQLVTGTAPHLYYDGVPPSWINRGTATGGPILSGSLSASSGSPSY
jgi:hypothetical protein